MIDTEDIFYPLSLCHISSGRTGNNETNVCLFAQWCYGVRDMRTEYPGYNVNLVVGDELAHLRNRHVRSTVIFNEQLDLSSLHRIVDLFQEHLKAVHHVCSDLGPRACQRREKAYPDRSLFGRISR